MVLLLGQCCGVVSVVEDDIAGHVRWRLSSFEQTDWEVEGSSFPEVLRCGGRAP